MMRKLLLLSFCFYPFVAGCDPLGLIPLPDLDPPAAEAADDFRTTLGDRTLYENPRRIVNRQVVRFWRPFRLARILRAVPAEPTLPVQPQSVMYYPVQQMPCITGNCYQCPTTTTYTVPSPTLPVPQIRQHVQPPPDIQIDWTPNVQIHQGQQLPAPRPEVRDQGFFTPASPADRPAEPVTATL